VGGFGGVHIFDLARVVQFVPHAIYFDTLAEGKRYFYLKFQERAVKLQ
jgi:hypothetical protein